MCKPVSRRLQSKRVFLRGAFPGDGLCSIDLPRKSAGYRGLPQSHWLAALSYGHQKSCVAQQSISCQRNQRLAHLCRFCPDTYSTSKSPVCQRYSGLGYGLNGLCSRLNNHRLMYEPVSLGALPNNQKRYQSTYAYDSARQHPGIYSYNQRQGTRCQDPGFAHAPARCFLHHGPCLSGLSTLIHSASGTGFQ